MKRVILFLALIMIISITGCNQKKIMVPDSPMNAAYLMKFHIDSQNYKAFQSLFYEGTEDTISKETFKHFDDLTTSSSNWKNYELITFSNGEMLLVEFAPKQEKEDEYKIVNVKEVPDEMKELFE